MHLPTFQLLMAAQASAAKAVLAASDPFVTIQAAVSDFAATGNPGTDWTKFKQAYDQATGQYRQAVNQDTQAARGKAPGGIPANLPPNLASLLAGKTTPAAAASTAAPAASPPAPAATPPAKAS